MDSYFINIFAGNAQPNFLVTAGFILLAVWSFFWKGMALWYSSKNNDKYWFIAILLLNTAGIIEIFYLFIYQKNKMTIKQLKQHIEKAIRHLPRSLKLAK